MHVFHGNRSAHQTEQPPIQEALSHYPQFTHMVEKVVHLVHDDVVYILTMDPQLLEVSKIDHPQFLVLHHLDQSPECQTVIFDMVKQDPSDHVDALHVAHLYIVNTVCRKNLLQHHSKFHIFRKSWTLGMRSREVFLNLYVILLGRLLFQQFLIRPEVRFLITLNPLLLPGTILPTETSIIAQFFITHPTKEGKFIPIKKRPYFAVFDTLRNDSLASSRNRHRMNAQLAR